MKLSKNNHIKRIGEKISNQETHKKFLMAVSIFILTSFFPNNFGILSLFISSYPLGLYGGEILCEYDLSILEKDKNL
ncbi:MAG: hypothetical protein ACOCP8_02070 [archaeon]